MNLLKQFSVKNLRLQEQLSVKWFLFLASFKKLYLVNFGLNFVGSLQNLSDVWEKITIQG